MVYVVDLIRDYEKMKLALRTKEQKHGSSTGLNNSISNFC